MDFIFDEDVDEVGADVEAFCPKCKADTAHVVISKYEDEIRRVQCNPCGDVHPYRKPRGDVDDEIQEPVSAKKKAAKVKPTWEQVMAKTKKEPRLYVVAEAFKENEVVSHPKFGVGFVSEVVAPDKIEVTFQTERRILIHNRQGMSLPASAYAHPVGRGTEGAGGKVLDQKGGKGKGGKAAPAPAPAAPAKPDKKQPARAASEPAAASAKPGKAQAVKPAEAQPAKGAAKAPPAAKAAAGKGATPAPAKAPPKAVAAKAASKPAAKAPAAAPAKANTAKAAAKPAAKPAPAQEKKGKPPAKPTAKAPAKPAAQGAKKPPAKAAPPAKKSAGGKKR